MVTWAATFPHPASGQTACCGQPLPLTWLAMVSAPYSYICLLQNCVTSSNQSTLSDLTVTSLISFNCLEQELAVRTELPWCCSVQVKQSRGPRVGDKKAETPGNVCLLPLSTESAPKNKHASIFTFMTQLSLEVRVP